MKIYESLHALVHSLTASEKRHFKLSIPRGKSSANYLVLFDAIASQEVYNEEEIKRKFKGEKFILQLHVTKNYLRNMILRSLRNYHSGISKIAEVEDMLRNIEILFNKELYKLCIAEIHRAEGMAMRFELDIFLMEIYQWKRKVTQAVAPFDIVAIAETVSREEQSLTRLNNTFAHKKNNVDIYHKVLSTTNLSGPGPVEALSYNSPAESLEAKVYKAHSEYYSLIAAKSYDKAEKCLYELIYYLEEHGHRIEEDPGLYVSTINNFLGYLVFSRQHDKALELVKRARSHYDHWRLASKTKVLLKQVLRTYNIELEIHRDRQRTTDEHIDVSQIESFIRRYEDKTPAAYAVLFWYQFASIYFMQKNYSVSLKWINKLLSLGNRTVRLDLQVYARILNLLIHLELKNLFVLGYYIDSTKRYLKKHKTYDPWKAELMKFFSVMRRTAPYDEKDVLSSFYEKVFPENGSNLFTQEVLDYIDIKRWLEERRSR